MNCKLVVLQDSGEVVRHNEIYWSDALAILRRKFIVAGAVTKTCNCGRKKVRIVKFKKSGLFLFRD